MIHPTSFPLWPVIIFLSITLTSQRVPTCLCADNEQFLDCSSTIQCGDLQNISYPFWGSNRASYCGLGDQFELTCRENTTSLLTIGNLDYRLLAYNNETKNFTVARNDYWDNYFPSTFYNSTQISSPLDYTSDTVPNNLTFYYGCQVADLPTGSLNVTSRFDCTINGSAIIGYYVTENVSDISTIGSANLSLVFEGCDTNVIVPAYVSAIQAIESNGFATTAVQPALEQGFGLEWTDADNACEDCAASGGRCGRWESSGDFACYCSDGPTLSTCSGSGSKLKTWLLISTVCAATAIIAMILKIWFRRCCKSASSDDNYNKVEMLINTHAFLGPKRYRYFELKKITNAFAEKIGQGGYGTVYKGKLSDGRLVAVKLLIMSKGYGEEFINEVASISRTSHVNVVNLLGFCFERNKRALIYEFMPNGSLDTFIPAEGALYTNSKINWKLLHQIVLGIARGLEYLHRGCKTKILHFDIKPQNILLDEDFIPKISDFGLSKLCLGKESIVSLLGTRGTIGYIAPEVFSRNFGRVSHKSDVYSYGMLVLAMVCGKSINNDPLSHSSDLYFPHAIYKQVVTHRDFKFQGIAIDEEEDIARKLILVSFWCIQTNPFNRPLMTKVVDMLEGSLHSVDMPPEPFLTDPTSQHQNSTMASPSSSSNNDGEEEESNLIVEIEDL